MPDQIIDTHIHPLSSLVQPKDIIDEMNKYKVKKAILLAMDLDPLILDQKNVQRDLNLALRYSSIYDITGLLRGMKFILENANTPNEYVAQIVSKFPDRFLGFGSVHLGYKSKKYVTQKLKEIVELGLSGIKILPTLQFFDPSVSNHVPLLFKFAEKHNLPVLYHTGCDPGPWELPVLSKSANPLLLESLIRRYPKVKVILAHIGSYSSNIPAIWFQEALYLMKLYSNVWGDLSAVPYLVTDHDLVQFIKNADVVKRILFGSDFPIVNAGLQMGMESCITDIDNSPFLSEQDKDDIFFNNAFSLFFAST